MKFISATDIGLVRSENQDNVYVDELEGGIFAVLCDGMGGENSGSEASSLAVNAVSEMFSSLFLLKLLKKLLPCQFLPLIQIYIQKLAVMMKNSVWVLPAYVHLSVRKISI